MAAETAGLYFRVADPRYPCIERAAVDQHGDQLELRDFHEGSDPEVIILTWDFKVPPPDFLSTLSQSFYFSEATRRACALENTPATALIPVRLVSRRKELISTDYWMLKVKSAFKILDVQRSKFEKVGSVYLRIDPFVVAWGNVPELDVFLVDEILRPVFSSRFVEAVRTSGLTGAFFVPVDGGKWPPKLS